MLHGSIVALVTPMYEGGDIDFAGLDELIEFHVQQGTNALSIAGTTGESITLTSTEKLQLIEYVANHVKDRIPVVAATGANGTRQAVELTAAASKFPIKACLVVTPSAIKPTQEGLYQHYHEIANATDLPIILYNVPARTACDLLPETVYRLSKVSNIMGIKEATGDLQRLRDILELCDNDFIAYSGDDLTAKDFIVAGGKGVISVTANVVPKKMTALCKAAIANDERLANSIQEQLLPLHEALFVEANPIPVKWALHEMGKIDQGIRLPLTVLAEKHHALLRKALQQAGV